jgi:hypothetical protein
MPLVIDGVLLPVAAAAAAAASAAGAVYECRWKANALVNDGRRHEM